MYISVTAQQRRLTERLGHWRPCCYGSITRRRSCILEPNSARCTPWGVRRDDWFVVSAYWGHRFPVLDPPLNLGAFSVSIAGSGGVGRWRSYRPLYSSSRPTAI